MTKRESDLTGIPHRLFENDIDDEDVDDQTPPTLERLHSAVDYAYTLHKNDIRKGTAIPYISHLLNVCGLVLWDGGDEDEAIAGLLHDALEDHPEETSGAEINRRFGPKVAAIVSGCSDTPEDYRGGTKPPWRERKEQYLKHVREADAPIRRVSMADKLDNARAVLADYRRLGDALWTRFNAGKEDQLWYYRGLVEAFREAGSSGLLYDELKHTVEEIERLCAAPVGVSPRKKRQLRDSYQLKKASGVSKRNPTEQDLSKAIDQMNPQKNRGFISLARPGGDYVQSAGGNGTYTVECRVWLDDQFQTFRHFVAGRNEAPGNDVRIPSSEINSVLVKQNECLSATEVKIILTAYLRDGTRHPRYVWRDITLNF